MTRSSLMARGLALLGIVAPTLAQGPVVEFAAGGLSEIQEGGAAVSVLLDLSEVQSADVVVDLVFTGEAEPGTDFTGAQATVVIPAGALQGQLDLVGLVDGVHEGDEGLGIEITAVAGADLGALLTRDLTLVDGDPLPVLAWDPTNPAIFDEGVGLVVLDAALSGPLDEDLQLGLALSGTATAGEDFAVQTVLPLVVTAGQTAVALDLDILGDPLHEGEELLQVEWLVLSGPVLGGAVQDVAITDDDAPPLVGFTSAAAMAAEAAGTVSVELSLSAVSGLPVTGSYSFSGTASFGGDLQVPSGSFTIPPGNLTWPIDLVLLDDGLDEFDETVVLALSVADGAGIDPAATSHTLTINDDDAPPLVEFALASSQVGEAAGTFLVEVQLSAVSGREIVVACGVGGSAGPLDHDLVAQDLVITAGQTGATLTGIVFDDSLNELSETVVLTLDSADGALLGTQVEHVLTLEDDDPEPSVTFALATSSVDEGAGGHVLEATLSAASGRVVTASFAVGGTAGALDHDLAGGQLVFDPGELSSSLLFGVLDDVLDEPMETIEVSLTTLDGAGPGSMLTHTVSLLDNDDPPSVAFAAAAAATSEGEAPVSVDVLLSAISGFDLTVPLSLSGDAASASDVQVSVTEVVIPAGSPGSSIQVTLVDDDLLELDEDLVVTLQAAENVSLGDPSSWTLTIADDEPLPAVRFLSQRSFVREEQGVALVSLVTDRASPTDIVVGGLTSGTATDGVDVQLPSGPFVIPAGATQFDLPVVLIDDEDIEGVEVLRLDLDPAQCVGATVGSPSFHRMRIREQESSEAPLRSRGVALLGLAGEIEVETRLGETSVFPFTLVNQGEITRTVEAVSLVGWGAGEFTFDFAGGAPPFVMAPGATQTGSLSFAPTIPGPRAAQLQVTDAPASEPSAQVGFEGVVLGPAGADLLMTAASQTLASQAGEVYAAEYGHTGGGSLSTVVQPISGTPDDALYHTWRSGPLLTYAWALPSGRYELEFGFAEPEFSSSGSRTFLVRAEGQTVVGPLDVVAATGGSRKEYRTGALVVDVLDGVLDVELEGVSGDALFQVLEARSVPTITVSPASHAYGTVDPGLPSQLSLVLENPSAVPVEVETLTFTPSLGSTADFEVALAGMTFVGGVGEVTHPVGLVLASGDVATAALTFTPTEHEDHAFEMRFEGTFGAATVQVTGTGGADPSWGFLHPVLTPALDLLVDYDASGTESVLIDGSDSHTHEPGRTLVGFEWTLDGAPVGTEELLTVDAPLGGSVVSLAITDDGTPPFSAADELALLVHPLTSVPGVLARFAATGSVDPSSLLDGPLPTPDYQFRQQRLRIESLGGLIGQTALTENALATLEAAFEVPAGGGTYEFLLSGGDGHRVFVDGVLASGPLALAEGPHQLEVRFAILQVSSLPAVVSTLVNGVLATDFWTGLTHSEAGVTPVIHSMPSVGSELGGNTLTLEGFGFWPRGQLTLHWGSTAYSGATLPGWTPTELTFVTPPGTGLVDVYVETPAGSSNVVTFEYSPTGPPPIQWQLLADKFVGVPSPTCLAWGPDGRLWVGTVFGGLLALEFDEDWNLIGNTAYQGVAGTGSPAILGLAFDPYDWSGSGQTQVYVAHAQLYANGGGSFSGPSAYTGKVSIVSGPQFDQVTPVLTGLPSSNHDHGINGLEFDHDGNLLVCVGGNTNAGVKWPLIGDVPESPLSGAILEAWISRSSFDGQVTYVHSTTGLPSTDQVEGEAVEVATGDVSVMGAGLRNPYDLVLHTSGALYATDNGPNFGYGYASTGLATDTGTHPESPDELVLLESGRYYGHANRSRGRWNPWEAVYQHPSAPSLGQGHTPPLALLESSADGICEYRSAAFASQLRGDLVVQKWNSTARFIDLGPTGRTVTAITQITPDFDGLDVVTGPGGALVNADFSDSKVRVLVPAGGAMGGLELWDVHPWRAPRSGGGAFVLGGQGFGDLGSTTVTVGGIAATLTTVSPTRIVGVLPVGPVETTGELVDVVVNSGASSDTLAAAFRWLPDVKGRAKGHWSTGVSLPDPLGEVSTVVIGRTLYVVGEGSSKTYGLDLDTLTWSDSYATRPYPGSHHSAQVIDGAMYLFGALGSGAGKVQIYDPVADAWSLGADMPWSGGSCNSALIDGIVYVSGGIVGSVTVSNLAAYDPVADTWNSSLPAMPVGVNHAASASDGESFWVFGGRQGGNTPQPGFDVVQRYDPVSGAWSTSQGPSLSPMPLARGGTGRAIHHGGRFLVMGGETSGGTTFAEVQVYDPLADAWYLDAPLPTARHGIDPVLDGDRIFVIGGGIVAGFSSSDLTEILQR